MKSPCILVCSIEQTSGHCYGCGRTSDEIASWTLFSDEVRQALMDDILPERVSKLERRPRRETKRTRQRTRSGETAQRATELPNSSDRDVLDISS